MSTMPSGVFQYSQNKSCMATGGRTRPMTDNIPPHPYRHTPRVLKPVRSRSACIANDLLVESARVHVAGSLHRKRLRHEHGSAHRHEQRRGDGGANDGGANTARFGAVFVVRFAALLPAGRFFRGGITRRRQGRVPIAGRGDVNLSRFHTVVLVGHGVEHDDPIYHVC